MANQSSSGTGDATATTTETYKQQTEDDDDDYIKTTTANYVSRCGVDIQGASQVELKGRSIVDAHVTLRGDLAVIRMGRYCRVGRNTTLSPPPLHNYTAKSTAKQQKQKQYVPMSIGNHTMIGPNCRLQAAAIGAYCWIGRNVKLGPRVIIKDACRICDNVTITADTVVPPFTRISVDDDNNNNNDKNNKNKYAALKTMELSPATVHMMQEESMEVYQDFAAQQKRRQEQM